MFDVWYLCGKSFSILLAHPVLERALVAEPLFPPATVSAAVIALTGLQSQSIKQFHSDMDRLQWCQAPTLDGDDGVSPRWQTITKLPNLISYPNRGRRTADLRTEGAERGAN